MIARGQTNLEHRKGNKTIAYLFVKPAQFIRGADQTRDARALQKLPLTKDTTPHALLCFALGSPEYFFFWSKGKSCMHQALGSWNCRTYSALAWPENLFPAVPQTMTGATLNIINTHPYQSQTHSHSPSSSHFRRAVQQWKWAWEASQRVTYGWS